jgi:hypothetical protein
MYKLFTFSCSTYIFIPPQTTTATTDKNYTKLHFKTEYENKLITVKAAFIMPNFLTRCLRCLLLGMCLRSCDSYLVIVLCFFAIGTYWNWRQQQQITPMKEKVAALEAERDALAKTNVITPDCSLWTYILLMKGSIICSPSYNQEGNVCRSFLVAIKLVSIGK